VAEGEGCLGDVRAHAGLVWLERKRREWKTSTPSRGPSGRSNMLSVADLGPVWLCLVARAIRELLSVLN
jgi:hypothetical protein